MAHCPRPGALVNDHHHDNDLDDYDEKDMLSNFETITQDAIKNLNSTLSSPTQIYTCSVTSSLMCGLVVSVVTPDRNL